jgi:hypothetical protein
MRARCPIFPTLCPGSVLKKCLSFMKPQQQYGCATFAITMHVDYSRRNCDCRGSRYTTTKVQVRVLHMELIPCSRIPTSKPLSLHAVSCTAQLSPKTRQNENCGGASALILHVGSLSTFWTRLFSIFATEVCSVANLQGLPCLFRSTTPYSYSVPLLRIFTVLLS